MTRPALLLAFASLSVAAHRPAERASCNDAAADSIVTVDVPGNPFQALPTRDGCWIFVSMSGGQGRDQMGIAVFQREGGRTRLHHVQRVAGNPTGMVITHDDRMVIVAAGPQIAFLDARRLQTRDDAVLGYLDEGGTPGRIYANVTSDDAFAFIADERTATVTVVDLNAAKRSRFNASSVVGKIPTGGAPIAVTFAPDEKVMYTTSQVAPPTLKWPAECTREGSDDSALVRPQGMIEVIDVERAKREPANAVVATIPSGCSTVRLVLSPDGQRVYVTARNSNSVLAFDRAKLQTDAAHALIGRVNVGTAPVGIAVADSGRRVIVTNSNRFAGAANDHQTLTVIDAAKFGSAADAIVGSIPAGAFPREMRVTADGRTLLLTNFGSRTLEIIDLRRALPKQK